MIHNGVAPVKKDYRDFDFHKTFGTIPQFPPEYNVELGQWTPNQNLPEPHFDNPALPFGCTDYTQADICADEDELLHNPIAMENVTHANANGGGDMRTSLKAAVSIFNRSAYYNVQAKGGLDNFDSVRLAMGSGVPEKRSVSVATRWYPEFENPTQGILSEPNWNGTNYTNHNWKICGWKIIGDQTYLIGKSWQGTDYADNGFHYISRSIFNMLMSQYGAAAFTVTKIGVGAPETIDLSTIQYWLSYIRTWVFGY